MNHKLHSYIIWTTFAGTVGILLAFGLVNAGTIAYHSLLASLTPPVLYVSEPVLTLPLVRVPKTTLAFVGDLMTARGVGKSVEKNFAGDYSKLFEKVSALAESDILFANLEGPVSDQGTKLPHLYPFRMAPEVIPALKNAGFDVLQVANNHIGDYGPKAFLDTLNLLHASGIQTAGGGHNVAEASEPSIIEVGGKKFGFLAFTDVDSGLTATVDQPGVLSASDPNLAEIIRTAAAKVDVLVACFHFGDEYQPGHNKRQQKLAEQAIDAGAKVVIGTHPHVVQEVEKYKDGLIAYSLGNFVFDQGFSKETLQGLALTVEFTGNKITKVSKQEVNIDPVSFQPSLGQLTDVIND